MSVLYDLYSILFVLHSIIFVLYSILFVLYSVLFVLDRNFICTVLQLYLYCTATISVQYCNYICTVLQLYLYCTGTNVVVEEETVDTESGRIILPLHTRTPAVLYSTRTVEYRLEGILLYCTVSRLWGTG